jgi:hypothetical protein
MTPIVAAALPADALLRVHDRNGAYVDSFATVVTGRIALEQFVAAFYTSGLFRIERWLLGLLVGRASTDAEALQLAAATRASFAAWDVEARDLRQLLLRDFSGRTRSWLMVEPAAGQTRLFFGSAVLATVDRRSGRPVLGWRVRALLGFHQVYSRGLLRAAVRRLPTGAGGA